VETKRWICFHELNQKLLAAPRRPAPPRPAPLYVCFYSYLYSMQSACAVLYCHLWPVRLYHIFFFHTIARKARFSAKKKILNIKCVFWFCLQILFETFLFPRLIQIDAIINVWITHYSYQILINLEFRRQISKKKIPLPNFTRIRPMRAEFFPFRRTQTDMKLIIAFRNFANAPKSGLAAD
jgi:hypothetical protein